MSLIKNDTLYFTTGFVPNSDDTTTEELPVKFIEHNGHAYVQINEHPVFLCIDTIGYLTDMLELHQRRIDTK